jgi:DedD protein
METRVKERLVGAVILVVVIVALVPEILSGPRRAPSAGDSAGAERPLRTYTIELEEQGSPVAPVEAEPPEPEPVAPATDSAERSEMARAEAKVQAERNTTPPAATASAARETASDAGWAVQLGSFSNAENAERLAAELRTRGYKAFVSRFESGGQARLRVRVGPEQDRARAEQLAERLRREGRQATVVAHP